MRAAECLQEHALDARVLSGLELMLEYGFQFGVIYSALSRSSKAASRRDLCRPSPSPGQCHSRPHEANPSGYISMLYWEQVVMRTPRTLVPLPPKVVAEIDRIAGRGHRIDFIVELLEGEIRRREQLAALENAAGAWKCEDHPELAEGSEAWVRKMRGASEARFQRLQDQKEST
jgi:hypothetical protein